MENASIMSSHAPSNTPVGTAVSTTELVQTQCNPSLRLHFERFDRFAHDDRDPFPSRCRMTRVHRHWRDLW